jgi:hypothetical protein
MPVQETPDMQLQDCLRGQCASQLESLLKRFHTPSDRLYNDLPRTALKAITIMEDGIHEIYLILEQWRGEKP